MCGNMLDVPCFNKSFSEKVVDEEISKLSFGNRFICDVIKIFF